MEEEEQQTEGEVATATREEAVASAPAGGITTLGTGDSSARRGLPPTGVEAAGVRPHENRSNSMPESGEVRAGVRKWRCRQRHSEDTHWHLWGDRLSCCWKS